MTANASSGARWKGLRSGQPARGTQPPPEGTYPADGVPSLIPDLGGVGAPELPDATANFTGSGSVTGARRRSERAAYHLKRCCGHCPGRIEPRGEWRAVCVGCRVARRGCAGRRRAPPCRQTTEPAGLAFRFHEDQGRVTIDIGAAFSPQRRTSNRSSALVDAPLRLGAEQILRRAQGGRRRFPNDRSAAPDPRGRLRRQHRRRPSIYRRLSSSELHPGARGELRPGGKPGLSRRDGPDPHQFPHGRLRTKADLSGYRRRQRIRQDRHGSPDR